MGTQKKTPYRSGRAVSVAILFFEQCPFVERLYELVPVPDGFIRPAVVTDITFCMTAPGIRGQPALHVWATTARTSWQVVTLL